MKRTSNTGVLLLLVALHVGSADASAGWIVHGRNRAGTRQAQHVLRPTSTEQHLAAGLSGFARPCLALRGGCSSADGSVSEGGGKGGGEAARESDSSGGATTAAAAAAAGGLDEDLYSRQLYVMGKTAMAKMGKADVLISGMRCVCLASCMLTYRGWVGGWVEHGVSRRIYILLDLCRILPAVLGLSCVRMFPQHSLPLYRNARPFACLALPLSRVAATSQPSTRARGFVFRTKQWKTTLAAAAAVYGYHAVDCGDPLYARPRVTIPTCCCKATIKVHERKKRLCDLLRAQQRKATPTAIHCPRGS